MYIHSTKLFHREKPLSAHKLEAFSGGKGLNKSVAAAAMAVTKMGASPSVPMKSEVLDKLNTMQERKGSLQ